MTLLCRVFGVSPGSTATAYSGTIFFGGKNVNFYEGSVLEIRARQCALQSYDGCTSIAGIATLNMNGIIRVTVTDDNKLAAGDSIRIWHAEAMTGTPVLELPAAFVWDTSRLSEGLLFVVSVDEERGAFRFIHASTSGGVMESESTQAYYLMRYIGAFPKEARGACVLVWAGPRPGGPGPAKGRLA